MDAGISVNRLGDLFHFGQLFKACDDNYFAQVAHILGPFCKGVKIFHFGATFIDIWRFFTGHTGWHPCDMFEPIRAMLL